MLFLPIFDTFFLSPSFICFFWFKFKTVAKTRNKFHKLQKQRSKIYVANKENIGIAWISWEKKRATFYCSHGNALRISCFKFTNINVITIYEIQNIQHIVTISVKWTEKSHMKPYSTSDIYIKTIPNKINGKFEFFRIFLTIDPIQ